MTGNKPWYLSKGVMGGVLSAICVVLSMFDIELSTAEQTEMLDQWLKGAAAFFAMFASYGRVVAKAKVDLAKPKRTGKLPLIALVIIVPFLIGCPVLQNLSDKSPTKRWASQRELLTSTENVLAAFYHAKKLSNEDVLDINIWIVAARDNLAHAEKSLPDGGSVFEDYLRKAAEFMVKLDAVKKRKLQEKTNERSRNPSGDGSGGTIAPSAGTPGGDRRHRRELDPSAARRRQAASQRRRCGVGQARQACARDPRQRLICST